MLSEADSDLVTAAVARAEATTDAEIVTIVAPRSDEYRDVVLWFAVPAMLLVPMFAALFPDLGLKLLALVHDAWSAPGEDLILGALMIAQILVFGLVYALLAPVSRRIALVPKSIRHARVRARAVLLFRVSAERRTDSRYGVLLYLSQEGRGTGLANKLRAYRLQDSGLDTLQADRYLGFRDDERDFSLAGAMLKALGVERVNLLTNNPRKIEALRKAGIEVAERVPLLAPLNSHNERYVRTKHQFAGHLGREDEQT